MINFLRFYIFTSNYHNLSGLMYTRNGENNSEDEEEYGYRQRGIGFGDADDVQEHGFEPRQQVEDDIFIFKNTELPGIPKTERIRKQKYQ